MREARSDKDAERKRECTGTGEEWERGGAFVLLEKIEMSEYVPYLGSAVCIVIINNRRRQRFLTWRRCGLVPINNMQCPLPTAANEEAAMHAICGC